MKFRDYTKYEVYEDGKIWSYSHKKWLKPHTNKNGYQRVCLVDNKGKKKMYYLHRIVYEAVTRRPIPKGYEINHISEVKTSNMITNLELLTHKQNCNFGKRNARMANTLTNGKLSKSVGAYNKNGELIMVFPSTAEAGRQGFKHSNIVSCCNGKRKTHRGFEWRYI